MASTRVYIGRLSYRARERDVEDFFRGYGKIREILLKNGFGFVEFDDPRDADDAVYSLNGRELCGERVVVEMTKRPPKGRDMFRSGGNFRSRSGRSPDRRRRDRDEKFSRYGPPSQTPWRCVVQNLSSRISWQDLKDFMRQAGEVTYADAHRMARNEGVVCFTTHSDLKRAIEMLDGKELNGRKIKLSDGSRGASRSCSYSRSGSSRSRSSYSRSSHSSRSRSDSVERRRRRRSRSPPSVRRRSYSSSDSASRSGTPRQKRSLSGSDRSRSESPTSKEKRRKRSRESGRGDSEERLKKTSLSSPEGNDHAAVADRRSKSVSDGSPRAAEENSIKKEPDVDGGVAAERERSRSEASSKEEHRDVKLKRASKGKRQSSVSENESDLDKSDRRAKGKKSKSSSGRKRSKKEGSHKKSKSSKGGHRRHRRRSGSSVSDREPNNNGVESDSKSVGSDSAMKADLSVKMEE